MNVIVNRLPTTDEMPDNAQAQIHLLGVEVDDVNTFAEEMISIVSDTNWIQKLNPLGKAVSYTHLTLPTTPYV